MNYIDIILGLLLIWAAYSGYRSGIIVQFGGIAGLILGVILAFRYGEKLGSFVNADPAVSFFVGFIIVLLLTILLIAVIGRLLRGVFRFAGLGIVDRIGGIILSVLKISLFLGVLLYGFDMVNRSENWVDKKTVNGSVLYKPLCGMSSYVFPFIQGAGEKIMELLPENQMREYE